MCTSRLPEEYTKSPALGVHRQTILMPMVTCMLCTVLLNYNFTLASHSTRGAKRYFVCRMLKYPVEIHINILRGRVIYTLHDTRRAFIFYT